MAYAIPQVFTTLRINSMGIRKIFAFAFSAWGIITIVTGFVQNVPEIYALRFILGLAEAPFMQVPCSLWASGLSRRSVVLQIPFLMPQFLSQEFLEPNFWRNIYGVR